MTDQALSFPHWDGELITVWPQRPTPTPMHPARLFLGRVLATPGALDVLDHASTAAILRRHMIGDWGDLDEEDREMNERALVHGDRVLSAYTINGTRLYVITEADRSATTSLLPQEY